MASRFAESVESRRNFNPIPGIIACALCVFMMMLAMMMLMMTMMMMMMMMMTMMMSMMMITCTEGFGSLATEKRASPC